MTTATKSGGDTGPTCCNTETLENSRPKELNGPTLSAAGVPAKTSVAPGSEPDLLGSVLGCFERWQESFASYGPGGWCGKTSGALFPLTEGPTSEPCLGVFPTSGMMRNGRCFALRTSDSPTGGRGFSLWRTPSDPKNRGSQPEARRREGGHTVNLEDQAEHQDWQNWKTPHGLGNVDRTGKRAGPGGGEFGKQANNWATPMGNDVKKAHINLHKSLTQDAVEFHPPHQAPDLLTLASNTSSNFTLKNLKKLKRFLRPSESKPNAGRKYSTAGLGSHRRLNPVFVEWLMGFPLLWTQPEPSDSRRSETPPCPSGGSASKS